MLTADSLNAKLPYLFGNEVEYLQQLGRNIPEHSTVVMLGIGPAVMALALLEGAGDKEIFLWGIDTKDFTGLAHVEMAGYQGKMAYVKGESWWVADGFSNESVDLLLVDACHTEECVKKDLEAWWGKVKPKGIIFLHDYIPQEQDAPNNGVAKAVENFLEPWKEIARPGISIVFEKLA